MRKIYAILLMFLVSLMLFGCGTSVKNENEILSDLQELERFTEENYTLSKITIDRRQTNKDEKEDFVYGSVEYNNDYYSIIEQIELKYSFYDKGGWLLDSIEFYENSRITKPLQGPTMEFIMKGWGLRSCASKISPIFDSMDIQKVVSSELTSDYTALVDVESSFENVLFTTTLSAKLDYQYTQKDGWNCVDVDSYQVKSINFDSNANWLYEAPFSRTINYIKIESISNDYTIKFETDWSWVAHSKKSSCTAIPDSIDNYGQWFGISCSNFTPGDPSALQIHPINSGKYNYVSLRFGYGIVSGYTFQILK